MVSLLIFIISIIVGRIVSNYYVSLHHASDLNYYHYLFGFPVIGIILGIAYYKRFGRLRRTPRVNKKVEENISNLEKYSETSSGIDEYHK